MYSWARRTMLIRAGFCLLHGVFLLLPDSGAGLTRDAVGAVDELDVSGVGGTHVGVGQVHGHGRFCARGYIAGDDCGIT